MDGAGRNYTLARYDSQASTREPRVDFQQQIEELSPPSHHHTVQTLPMLWRNFKSTS